MTNDDIAKARATISHGKEIWVSILDGWSTALDEVERLTKLHAATNAQNEAMRAEIERLDGAQLRTLSDAAERAIDLKRALDGAPVKPEVADLQRIGDLTIPTFAIQDIVCSSCGHQHAGASVGRICIGCPCEERPGQ